MVLLQRLVIKKQNDTIVALIQEEENKFEDLKLFAFKMATGVENCFIILLLNEKSKILL